MSFASICIPLVQERLAFSEALLGASDGNLVSLRCQAERVLEVGTPLVPVLEATDVVNLWLAQALIELERLTVQNLRLVWPSLLTLLLLIAVLAEELSRLGWHQEAIGEDLAFNTLVAVEVLRQEPGTVLGVLVVEGADLVDCEDIEIDRLLAFNLAHPALAEIHVGDRERRHVVRARWPIPIVNLFLVDDLSWAVDKVAQLHDNRV